VKRRLGRLGGPSATATPLRYLDVKYPRTLSK
jgi:hypothetical protein